jgi:hypothetical protein
MSILRDQHGKPTLLGEAITLLDHAQVDRRLAQATGMASYYEDTQEFLARVRTLAASERPRDSVEPVSTAIESDPVARILFNIEECIVRLRAKEDRCRANSAPVHARIAAGAIAELASLREELQGEPPKL